MLLNVVLNYLAPDLPVESQPSKCMNRRQKNKTCRRCVKACPRTALSFESDKISRKKSLCISCGLCVSICPASAHSQSLKPIEKKYPTLKAHGSSRLTIGCSQSKAYLACRYPCLLGLSSRYLLALALFLGKEEIICDTQGCRNCPTGKNVSFNLEEKIGPIRDLLKALGTDIKISIKGDTEDRQIETFSRRDFFKEMNTVLKKEISLVECDFNPEEIIYQMTSKLPLNDVEMDRGIFKSLSLNEGCDLCHLCSAICPNEAWKRLEQDGQIELKHGLLKCRGCGLCLDSCPNKAIEVKEVYSLGDLKTLYRRKLKRKGG